METQPDQALELNGQENGFITELVALTTLDPVYGVPVVKKDQAILTAENIELESEIRGDQVRLVEDITKQNMAMNASTAQESHDAEASIWREQVAKDRDIIRRKQGA